MSTPFGVGGSEATPTVSAASTTSLPIMSAPISLQSDQHTNAPMEVDQQQQQEQQDGAPTASVSPLPLTVLPPSASSSSNGHRRSRGSKHSLSVTPPANGILPLSVVLSPNSEAKRFRTGDYTTPTPNQSPTPSWSGIEVPMSPATSFLQNGLATVSFNPMTNTTNGVVKNTPILKSSVPPSPSAAASSLPPTHPHPAPTFHYPSSPSLNGLTSKEFASLHASPSRSGTSSASSSPSSFSLGGGPASLSTTSSVGSVSSVGSTSTTSVQQLTPSSPISISPLPLSASTRLSSSTTAQSLQQQHQSPFPPVGEDDEGEDDGGGGTVVSSGSGKKKADRSQGASCHQCKTTKDEQHLLFCSTKAGGPRKRRCRKKYCDSCLSRTYGMSMSQLISSGAANQWQCPSCLGKCTCAGCTRKVGGSGARGAASSTHGSLAIPPTLLEMGTTPATTSKREKKRESAAAAAAAAAASANESNATAAPSSSSTDKWTSASTSTSTNNGTTTTLLPPAQGFAGRAVSAPIHSDHLHQPLSLYGQHHTRSRVTPASSLQSESKQSELDEHESEDHHLTQHVTPPPAKMDEIASLLLELSTTSNSTSSTADSSSSANGTSLTASSSESMTSSISTSSSISSSSSIPSLTASSSLSSASMYSVASPSTSGFSQSPFNFSTSGPVMRTTMNPIFPETSVGLAKRFTTPTSLLSSGTSISTSTGSPSNASLASRSPHIPMPMTKYTVNGLNNQNGVSASSPLFLPFANKHQGRTSSEHSTFMTTTHNSAALMHHQPMFSSSSSSSSLLLRAHPLPQPQTQPSG